MSNIMKPYNHVGVLVADLEGAKRRFSAALGVTWTESRQITVRTEGAEEGELAFLAVISDGEPYIELLQPTTSSNFFSLQGGDRLHHIGGFVAGDDPEASIPVPPDITCVFMGQKVAWFSDLGGVAVEYMSLSTTVDSVAG